MSDRSKPITFFVLVYLIFLIAPLLTFLLVLFAVKAIFKSSLFAEVIALTISYVGMTYYFSLSSIHFERNYSSINTIGQFSKFLLMPYAFCVWLSLTIKIRKKL